MRRNLLIGALAAAAVLTAFAAPAAARTLRWASQGDILTFDPMAQNESLNNTFADYVYDGLVRYNKQFVPEPALAASWTRPEPTRWRFVLRKGVRFHDGSPLTADDVVFSIERAAEALVEHEDLRPGREGGRRRSTRTRSTSSPTARTRCCCAAWSTSRS